MEIAINLITLGILAISIFFGYKKGLVGVAFKLCALIVSIVVTLILFQPISNLVIEKTELDEKIENIIVENGTKQQSEENETQEQNTVAGYIDQYVENTTTQIQNNIVESSARTLAINIVKGIVIIGLFIVIRIALILLNFLADTIAELPIVKQFNKLGGIIYGALRGIVIIYIILIIATFINPEIASTSILGQFLI